MPGREVFFFCLFHLSLPLLAAVHDVPSRENLFELSTSDLLIEFEESEPGERQLVLGWELFERQESLGEIEGSDQTLTTLSSLCAQLNKQDVHQCRLVALESHAREWRWIGSSAVPPPPSLTKVETEPMKGQVTDALAEQWWFESQWYSRQRPGEGRDLKRAAMRLEFLERLRPNWKRIFYDKARLHELWGNDDAVTELFARAREQRDFRALERVDSTAFHFSDGSCSGLKPWLLADSALGIGAGIRICPAMHQSPTRQMGARAFVTHRGANVDGRVRFRSQDLRQEISFGLSGNARTEDFYWKTAGQTLATELEVGRARAEMEYRGELGELWYASTGFFAELIEMRGLPSAYKGMNVFGPVFRLGKDTRKSRLHPRSGSTSQISLAVGRTEKADVVSTLELNVAGHQPWGNSQTSSVYAYAGIVSGQMPVNSLLDLGNKLEGVRGFRFYAEQCLALQFGHEWYSGSLVAPGLLFTVAQFSFPGESWILQNPNVGFGARFRIHPGRNHADDTVIDLGFFGNTWMISGSVLYPL